MISFLRTLVAAEIKSRYLNLTDAQGRTYGHEFPPSLTHLTVVDQLGRKTRAQQHHANQIWGTLYEWYEANQPSPSEQIIVAYDPLEQDEGRPVLHLELLRPEDAIKSHSKQIAGFDQAAIMNVQSVSSERSMSIQDSVAQEAEGCENVLRRDQLLRRLVRDTRLSRSLKLLYHHECQLCRTTIQLPNGGRYSEAHHLRPLGSPHHGQDIPSNILIVCPNHHAMLEIRWR